ncbi:MFS transporter [Frateuria aurantia]
MTDLRPADLSTAVVTRKIVGAVIFNFLAYLVIGMQLSTLPSFVHTDLRSGAVVAGLVISVQYIATLLSRGFAGRTSDTAGPRYTVLIGLGACAINAALVAVAGELAAWPLLCISLLLVARLALGVAESCIGTGCIIWGIGRVGAGQTARVISWSGVATYSALAAGAPLGVLIQREAGMPMIGLSSLVIMALAFGYARRQADVVAVAGERMPMSHVFGRVLPYGMGLAMGAIGFGVIATFITLYYAWLHWLGAAVTLSVFGLCFVGVRLMFGPSISRYGGYRVAMLSFLVEGLGLAVLAFGPTPGWAILGTALTGMGFSLVFPSLGVEAVNRVNASNRGAALAAYSVFVDVALGVVGPVGGVLADHQRYSDLFALAAVLAVAALALTWRLLQHFGEPAAASA